MSRICIPFTLRSSVAMMSVLALSACADLSGLSDLEFVDASSGGTAGSGGSGGGPCVPESAETLCADIQCGTIVDNCGDPLVCPDTCVDVQQCGVGGVDPNTCGCTGSPNSAPPAPEGCSSVAGQNGNTFYICTIDTNDWEESRTFCQSFGTDLPVITSAAENDILNANIVANVHIGLHDPSECKGAPPTCGEERFEWINGEPVVFTHWGSIEPNNSQSFEHCTELSANTTRWNDVPCASLRATACETTCPN